MVIISIKVINHIVYIIFYPNLKRSFKKITLKNRDPL